jgi:phosphoglycerate dehydrogenase-like enzyme
VKAPSAENNSLNGPEAFAAMKPNATLVNVARGEIIDEDALLGALDQGELRRCLDVYVGEFESQPNVRLWDDERVILTPNLSAGSDVSRRRGVELFCGNLRACLDRQPLANAIDWARGY